MVIVQSVDHWPDSPALIQASHVVLVMAPDKSPMFALNGEGFVIGRTASGNFDLPVKIYDADCRVEGLKLGSILTGQRSLQFA
ncbi:hypothetical protein [Rhizobium sp. SL42]|uniref:hypothetical protein n=1 Tax=Rhizobium sp. SL42 TaxID=2806346 RepID=UPI001F2B91E2|nr:hypothetical protein [Rhizobium sp. SL42]UJW76927.1 hypothetical protein IM739_20730 [Rhizobium sp. SL42]